MSFSTYNRPKDCHAFEIAIICALSLEADAMLALFDDFWEREEQYTMAYGDTNSYTIGRICQHDVVLVHLARMGKVSTANVAANLRLSFPQIRLGLLVGMCGAVPFIKDDKTEILLGDIVISTHIVQTDFGRQYSDTFSRKNSPQDNLARPNLEVRGFLSKLQTKAAQKTLKTQIQNNLVTIFNAEGFHVSKYPGVHNDKLYKATYLHKHQEAKDCAVCAKCVDPKDPACQHAPILSCANLKCDTKHLVPRNRIEEMINQDGDSSLYTPMVHFGVMASGDQVIKSAQHRDRIANQENVIAFEMEGAGLWETIPTIVVKGVCDYADSHKNKEWQAYAAAAAAACAKGLLMAWRTTRQSAQDERHEGENLRPVHQVFSGNFTAGKNIINGGTYTAESINFW